MTRRPTNIGKIGRGVLAVPVLALVAAGAAGCTIESGTNEGKVSTTASTYLRALANGDSARACAQLTPSARGGDCAQTIKARTSRLDPAALNRAADHSLEIDVHGNSATVRLSEPAGARFALVKLGARWRIDSGYTIGASASVVRPGVGMSGIELDMTPAQVRTKLGRPTDRTPPGPGTETEYRYGDRLHPRLTVTFSAHRTVRQIIGFDRPERTRSGVGVGSTERALRNVLHGERCHRPTPGSLRQCDLRRQANGENRTTSFVFGDPRPHRVLFVVIAVEPSHRAPATSPPTRRPLP
jgi:hypothetical protein